MPNRQGVALRALCIRRKEKMRRRQQGPSPFGVPRVRGPTAKLGGSRNPYRYAFGSLTACMLPGSHKGHDASKTSLLAWGLLSFILPSLWQGSMSFPLAALLMRGLWEKVGPSLILARVARCGRVPTGKPL